MLAADARTGQEFALGGPGELMARMCAAMDSALGSRPTPFALLGEEPLVAPYIMACGGPDGKGCDLVDGGGTLAEAPYAFVTAGPLELLKGAWLALRDPARADGAPALLGAAMEALLRDLNRPCEICKGAGAKVAVPFAALAGLERSARRLVAAAGWRPDVFGRPLPGPAHLQIWRFRPRQGHLPSGHLVLAARDFRYLGPGGL